MHSIFFKNHGYATCLGTIGCVLTKPEKWKTKNLTPSLSANKTPEKSAHNIALYDSILYLNALITLLLLLLALSERCGLHDVQMLWTDFLALLYFILKDKVSAVLLKKYFQSKIYYLISANNFQNK